jgi:hypothetical protein
MWTFWRRTKWQALVLTLLTIRIYRIILCVSFRHSAKLHGHRYGSRKMSTAGGCSLHSDISTCISRRVRSGCADHAGR